MVDALATVEGIKDARVLEAMRDTPRHEFVSKRWRPWAYYDMALPIGHAQTLTPPSLVAYMTEQLEVQPHHRVLEVGTGCGYQTAILSRLAQAVYTVEIVGPLGRRARATLRRLKHDNVQVRTGDGFRGWPEMAPFDRIQVTCSPEAVPAPLIAQLAEGGRLIIPLGGPYQQNLYRFVKTGGKLVREVLMPTVFVPMTGEAEAARTRRADPLHPALVNGDFEQIDSETRQLLGWYHQKQLSREQATDAPGGGAYVTFRNLEPGRAAHAAQAFPIDGRRVRTVNLRGWVKSDNVRPGTGAHQIAAVVAAFYDHDRALLSQQPVGDWRGTFDWRPFEGRVIVPTAAREASLLIGLHGATGSLSLAVLSTESGAAGVGFGPGPD
jgi:protein-L-isoaspartate(D-aspartate) O-methyltransferase